MSTIPGHRPLCMPSQHGATHHVTRVCLGPLCADGVGPWSPWARTGVEVVTEGDARSTCYAPALLDRRGNPGMNREILMH
jgi:hypothetical protein